MNEINQNIYQELLANDRFVAWTSGKNPADNLYWRQWKEKNPGSQFAFDEACRTVNLLKFKKYTVSEFEVSERWDQSRAKMPIRLKNQNASGMFSWYYRIAGILLFPIIIVSLWFFYNQLNLQSEFARINGYIQGKSIRVKVPIGGQLTLELPDSSMVWLNSGSEINYPVYFTQGKREVEIVGEAYFKVTKSNKMFVVRNPGPTIQVYGTEFNVHAYPDEKKITVALVNGNISLDQGDNQKLKVEPGEVASFDQTAGKLTKKTEDINQYISWREGKYIFRDASLELILKTLERKYNVAILLKNPELNQSKFNATIEGEPLEQVLELLTFSSPLRYEYKPRQVKADGSYSKAEVTLWKDTTKKYKPLN